MGDNKQISIFNPEPRKLPGPELLHLLVSGAETGGDIDTTAVSDHSVASAPTEPAPQPPALDYRAPDGTHVTLSYPELHQTARALAAEILRRLHAVSGVSTESSASAPKELVVPVLIPQAPELYVSLLAILKAGGAFCPIQLDAPPDRIRFILGDVGADVVLTTSAMAAELPVEVTESLQVIFVDELRLFDRQYALLATPELSVVPRAVGPDDLAYVMYTSGSTGTPKGVGVPHGAATQSLLSHDRHVPSFQRFLQFAAPTFDVSVFEIFFPWFRGATLACCSRAEMLDDLPAVITSLNVDACELTPTVAGSLLQSRANAPGLRLLLTIGEMLTEPVIREFGAGPEQTSILWAMYGPTEAAIHW
jgi:ferricrocin synthase